MSEEFAELALEGSISATFIMFTPVTFSSSCDIDVVARRHLTTWPMN